MKIQLIARLTITILITLSILAACTGTDQTTTSGKPDIKNPETFIYADHLSVDSLDPAYAYDVASARHLSSIY